MRRKVLVIDDDDAITLALSVRLGVIGYEVNSAADGPSGLKMAQGIRPDVILLDIRMPGMDGFEVNRRLKRTPELAGIPVIFLSAQAHERARHEALEAGAKFFLSKPYGATQLVAAIEAAVADANNQPVGSTRVADD